MLQQRLRLNLALASGSGRLHAYRYAVSCALRDEAGQAASSPVLQAVCRASTKPQVITMSDPAKKSLDRTANACHRVGWLSFWTQLSLSVVSAGILLFSVAFTSQVRACKLMREPVAVQQLTQCWVQNGPSVTLYLTLFGIAASFLSTFWAYQYTRLARRLRLYAQRGPQGSEGRLTKASVRKQLWQASFSRSVLLFAAAMLPLLLTAWV